MSGHATCKSGSEESAVVKKTEPVLDDPQVYLPILRSISASLGLLLFCQGLTIPARLQMLLDIKGGNISAAAKANGNIQSAGALLEFAIGPLMGKLSDVYGRKFVMQLCPLAMFVSNAAVIAKPFSLWSHYLRVCSIALGTAYMATMRATLTDVMSGRNIAENAYFNMALAGLCQVGAPVLAAKLSGKACFRLATAAAAAMLLMTLRLRETLPEDQRKPPSSLDFGTCNPFAFYHLFRNGKNLAALSLISAVQTCTDCRLSDEPHVLALREKLSLNESAVHKQFQILQLCNVLGAVTGKFSVKGLGRMMHTHFSNGCRILGYLLLTRAAGPASPALALGHAVLLFSQRQRDGVETIMTEVGVRHGMGRGQVEAYKMNFRSVTNIIAPVAYARAFALGCARRVPDAPLYLSAAATSLAEAIVLSLDESSIAKELGIASLQ